MKKIKKTFYVPIIIILCFLYFSCGNSQKGDVDTDSANDETTIISLAWDFRNIVLRNYSEALELFANKNARKKFAEIDRTIWADSNPNFEWAFFFEGVVLCPYQANGNSSWVAFYHSFADVFLILVFDTKDKDQILIDDAYILAGSFVREQGNTPFKTERLWTTQDVYAPYAVGIAAAETIKAYEKLFSGNQDFNEISKKLMTPKIIEANQIGAGIQIIECLSNLPSKHNKDKDSDITSLVWKKLIKINEQILAGEIKTILNEANKTPSDHSKALKDLKIEDWKSYMLVAYVEADNYGLVMLQNSTNPDIYISLLMKKRDNEMQLSRVDFLSINNFYKEYDNIKL